MSPERSLEQQFTELQEKYGVISSGERKAMQERTEELAHEQRRVAVHEQRERGAEALVRASANERGLWHRAKQRMGAAVLSGLAFAACAKPKEPAPAHTVLSPEPIPSTGEHVGGDYAFDSNWDVEFMTSTDENGHTYFDPLGLVMPKLVRETAATTRGEIKIDVPEQYARVFKAKGPLRPEDREKAKRYIEGELQQQVGRLMERLHTEGPVPELLKGRWIQEKQQANPELHIKAIRITGSASPEGHEAKGPSTVQPGAVDAENLVLAKQRAEGAHGLVKEALQRIGVSDADFDHVYTMIGGEEIQYGSGEWAALEALAEREHVQGVSDQEKIFNLHVKYNDGKITDSVAKAVMDKIVGQKRSVEIEIEYEAGAKKKAKIPVPLFLLLALAIPRIVRRRREGQYKGPLFVPYDPKKDKLFRPTPPRGPIPPQAPVPPRGPIPAVQPQELTPDWEWEAEDVYTVEPEWEAPKTEEPLPPTSPIEDDAIVDDLYRYFDDPETIKGGIDYAGIANALYHRWDMFQTHEERIAWLTPLLLSKWQSYDEAKTGTSLPWYQTNAHQEKWAHAHASALVRITAKKREAGEQMSYSDIMNALALDAMNRRTERRIQQRWVSSDEVQRADVQEVMDQVEMSVADAQDFEELQDILRAAHLPQHAQKIRNFLRGTATLEDITMIYGIRTKVEHLLGPWMEDLG